MNNATHGVLLLNLGTPSSPHPLHVGRYLREFLMDPYVIDIPFLARAALVHGVIVPFRTLKSAHAYRSVWRDDGSPLQVFHSQFVDNMKKENPDLAIAGAMRYGEPSVRQALRQLRERGVEHLTVWPLYPQWAWASTASSFAYIDQQLKRINWNPKRRNIQDFYDHSAFISSFAKNIEKSMAEFTPDLVLFSFHGIPERHLFKKGHGERCMRAHCCDFVNSENRYCYRAQCYTSAYLMASHIGLSSYQWQVSFQSRLGRNPWIQPFTDVVLKDLAQQGVKRILVACPSFVADCLETLEEIAVRERESFISYGGEDLKLVPSLNGDWAKAASQILRANLSETGQG